MLSLMFKPMAMVLPRGFSLPGPISLIPARLNPPEPGPMPEPYQLELIRSYATAGFTAVVTINSGALIAGLSQVKNIDFVPPVAIAVALLIWAIGVTTGVATWGRRLQRRRSAGRSGSRNPDALEARCRRSVSHLAGHVPARLPRRGGFFVDLAVCLKGLSGLPTLRTAE
jgi:hypothetical protein